MDLLRDEYGIECDRRRIGSYDPTRPYYHAGEKWREIFEARRKAFLEEVATVPIANQGYRLQKLRALADKAEKGGNLALAAGLLEQAAKEVGGVLTNHRHTTIEEGRQKSAKDMTPEERQAALAEIIRKVQDDKRRDKQEIVQ